MYLQFLSILHICRRHIVFFFVKYYKQLNMFFFMSNVFNVLRDV